MPLYEYYCPPCGSQFEVLRPVSQMDSPAVCPEGHTTNNRVISLFAAPRSIPSNVAIATLEPPSNHACACGGNCSC